MLTIEEHVTRSLRGFLWQEPQRQQQASRLNSERDEATLPLPNIQNTALGFDRSGSRQPLRVVASPEKRRGDCGGFYLSALRWKGSAAVAVNRLRAWRRRAQEPVK